MTNEKKVKVSVRAVIHFDYEVRVHSSHLSPDGSNAPLLMEDKGMVAEGAIRNFGEIDQTELVEFLNNNPTKYDAEFEVTDTEEVEYDEG